MKRIQRFYFFFFFFVWVPCDIVPHVELETMFT
jgi:hypothetical protein